MAFKTYGNLELLAATASKECCWLMTGLQPHVSIRLKNNFPRILKTQTDNFSFPNDEINCADLDWFCSRYPLKISKNDNQLLKLGRNAFESTQAELEQILTPNYIASDYDRLMPGQKVRHYQSQAVDVLMRRFGLLLGDTMGLGKTYTAIAAMLKPGTLPAAVVVQTHLQGQWENKITEFSTLKVHKIKKTTVYPLPEADVYIFKYSQLAGWVDFFTLKFFKMAVFDEIQELRRGEESGKGRGAYALRDSVIYKLGLSGTPIFNYGAEIFNVLKAVDETVLGSHVDFMREWTDGDKKVNNPKALGTYLRENHVFIRRTKQDVGQQMPPINRIVEVVDTNQKVLDDMNKLARILALKVVNGSFTERGQAARELNMLARHATGVAKAPAVAAYVRIFLENDIPVLLAGWHRDVYDIWLKELAAFKPAMYTGSETPAQKKKSLNAFLAGETNLLIMSLRSGAGVDGLQKRCSTVIIGELDWSGEIHLQLIARLDREGQEEQVTAIYLHAEDGSDPPMIDLLGVKSSQSHGIVDPHATLKTVYSDKSQVRALCSQFLSKGDAEALAASNDVLAILPEPEMDPD